MHILCDVPIERPTNQVFQNAMEREQAENNEVIKSKLLATISGYQTRWEHGARTWQKWKLTKWPKTVAFLKYKNQVLLCPTSF